MTKMLVMAAAFVFLVAGVLSLATFAFMLTRDDQPAGPEMFSEAAHYHVPASATDEMLTEYQLLERSGETFDSKSLEGKVHVTSFFFSRCPNVCLLQNQEVAKVAAEFGPKDVQFISITCDPDHDTPTVLRTYAARLGADEENWLFLTGDLGYIKRVGNEIYRLPFEQQAHSEKLVAVDKWGNIRGAFHFNDPAQMKQLDALLPELLAETEEPLIDNAPVFPEVKTGLEPGESDEPETSNQPAN